VREISAALHIDQQHDVGPFQRHVHQSVVARQSFFGHPQRTEPADTKHQKTQRRDSGLRPYMDLYEDVRQMLIEMKKNDQS